MTIPLTNPLNGDRPTDTGFEGWAILELFGHKRMAGFVSSQQVAGGALVRIDVPATEPTREGEHAGPTPAYTKLVGLAAIYGITPCTEDLARRAAREIEKYNNPLPLSLPMLTAGAPEPVHTGAHDEYEVWDDDAADRVVPR